MKRSTDRILTTTVGSLVRPPEVLEAMRRKVDGQPFDPSDLAVVKEKSAEAVKKQREVGVDIPSDGEFSKSSFAGYVTDRLTGWEFTTKYPMRGGGTARSRDRRMFPDFYDAERSSNVAPANQTTGWPVCTGPITYRGEEATKVDLENFKSALAGQDFEEAFVPACGPATIELQRANVYYKTEEEYLFAIAEAMKTEYKMIVDAGFILQIDDPRIVTEWDSFDPEPTPEEYRKFAEVRIEALNMALKGLPEDRVRYHLCWGSWPGPHVTDAPLGEIAEVILKVNAGAFSIEGANTMHEHEYHTWERIKFPEGKVLIPGVVAHSTSHVEHPELVKERIMRYANLVGRENVIATTDCGFAQGAGTARVPTSIMWEKLRRLSQGAELASKALWG
ncbi:MAG: cobalamin-independent methionine synthase II family protein [Dehalococcoidia bacterium]